MERFLSKIRLASHPEYQSPYWQPPVDVYQSGDSWILKFDLAGVEQHSLRVAVEGRRVIVSGERRDLTVAQGCRAYQMEISYNQFERLIELPTDLEATSSTFDYRDGMLLVTVRSAAAQGG